MISDARNGHVSPGIYTEEKDVTYSVKSLGITSLGLVGETLYGPAFENIEIKNWSEFVSYFGGTSTEKFKGSERPKYELPYIAKSYLEASNRLNVVRVLGLSGYYAGPHWLIKMGNKLVGVIRSKMVYQSGNGGCSAASENEAIPVVKGITESPYTDVTYDAECKMVDDTDNITTDTKESTDNRRFTLTVSCEDNTGYNSSYTYNISLNPTDSNYIYNVLGGRPDNGSAPIYIESLFESSVNKDEEVKIVDEANDKSNFNDYKEGFRAAQTPWIVSDAVVTTNSSSVKTLFRFITISDGDIANYQIKVSIQNIDPVACTFDVVVRDFYDRDDAPVVLERFVKCNLIEGDSNYIAHKIGTSDGGFVSKSKYILVEMAKNNDLKNNIPAGFLGYPIPKYSDDLSVDVIYNINFDNAIKPKKQYFGFSNLTGIEKDILSYKGVHAYSEEGNLTKGFHMDAAISGSTMVDDEDNYEFTTVSKNKVSSEGYIPRLVNMSAFLDNSIYKDIKTRKFTVCFYGGFDGWDVNRSGRTNTDKYKATMMNVTSGSSFDYYDGTNNLNLPLTAITSDYYAYLAGYKVFANPQDIDINLFATPGIDWYNNKMLTEEVIDIIEDAEDGRGGDALYVMASPSEFTADELSDYFIDSDINSSYACTYAPWVMYYDASNKRYVNLPVTKDVVRNMAATDNNSYPWFAPAGMERGNVNCVKAEYKTTLADEDTLYENRVNPVKTFAQDGVKIWGNKTTYNVESPLNRINVRRLMIRVKKLVTSAAKNLIFTQYDDTLEKQFKGIIEPILADVKSNRGISDYRIITEITPEARDQHILPAKILIKPTPALEYISISFVVYPESVSFEND